MEMIAFDTLAYSKELIDAGLDEKIAQAHAKTQVEILKNMLTKQDIDSGRLATTQDLFVLEQRLVEKFMRHIDTASSDRQVIRGEMRQGFTANLADHQAIRDEMAEGFAAATKDHQIIRDEMAEGFAAATKDHQIIRDKMAEGFALVAKDHQMIRDEMRTGFTANLADHQAIRDEMAESFALVAKDHQMIRDEMRAGFTANAVDHQMLRNEMKSLQLQTIGILGSMMVAGFTILGIIMRLLTQ